MRCTSLSAYYRQHGITSGGQFYDAIGATYGLTRRTEPRIAAQIWGALGDSRTRFECRCWHRPLRTGGPTLGTAAQRCLVIKAAGEAMFAG